MAQRPTFIDLPSRSHHGPHPDSSSPGLPSPRRPHIAGDVPPAMSPLDAFAAQSRMLAKQLDDSRQNDRRISRLPPLAVADTLSKPRPGYFRSASVESSRARMEGVATPTTHPYHEEEPGNRMEIESPAFRPKSHYPMVSRMAPTADGRFPSPSPLAQDQVYSTPFEYQQQQQQQQQPQVQNDYFGAPRAQSPEHSITNRKSVDSSDKASIPKSQGSSFDSLHRKTEIQRGLSTESSSSRSQYSHSLLPPNPPYARKTPSLISMSSDDENSGGTPRSSISQQRKLSSSSAVSMPQSPLSPFVVAHERSPSVASEYSINGHRISRPPAFNFSRPLSHSSRPSMEFTTRRSMDSQKRASNDDPVEASSTTEPEEGIESTDQQTAEPSSYIYAKFSLPRGRMVHRDSLPLESLMPNIEFDKPKGKAVTPPDQVINSSLPTPPHSIESEHGHPIPQERNSTDGNQTRPIAPRIPTSKLEHRRSMTSMNSSSTIKGSARTVTAGIADLTAEEHLDKGIECHEQGSLNKSTYHLRIAARQGNSTAMLLYALACRHGWGMRQNPAEGVQWLRKAMDSASASLELENEGTARGHADAEARKTRRAQFALSVYELGVSHMNGWGIEQDKTLALKCFETASNWGDADAMAEAGFCYAQGVGCKKDLKKAAKYYRDAEARGMSMVGNSWIYKPKYADSGDEGKGRLAKAPPADKEKKPRDKSRTRTLFGRKKSVA